MDITVEVKSVYGNEAIYPYCDKAKGFCELLGQKTLTRRDIKIIEKLGYVFKVKQPAVTL